MTTRTFWLLALPLLMAGLVFTAGAATAEDTPAGEKPKADEKKEEAKKAADFELKDYNDKTHKLSDYTKQKKWVILEWVNHGCPFVKKHYDASHKHMQGLQKKYCEKDVIWLSICSTNPDHKDYLTKEQWKAKDKELGGAGTAVLMDADGKVGRLYGARTTPEIFVINPKGEIVYHGAIDDKRRPRPVDIVLEAKNYLEEVMDAVLAGKPSPHKTTKPYGCSVKYAKKPAADTDS